MDGFSSVGAQLIVCSLSFSVARKWFHLGGGFGCQYAESVNTASPWAVVVRGPMIWLQMLTWMLFW